MSNIDAEKTSVGNAEMDSAHSDPKLELESPAEDGAPLEERKVHGIKWALAVLAILSSTFLFALDTTVVADVQPNVVASFGSIDKLPWLGVGFLLPVAALDLPWSKAYAIFNIKWLYISNVVLFEVGSALSGGAPTMNALIVGRILAGIGGSGMYIGGMTYFSVLTTSKERPVYISLITPVWGLGTVLGPIVGGGFAVSSATWRWGFYINLIIFAVTAPIMVFCLPAVDLQPTVSLKNKLKSFDWLGLTVFTGWIVSFTMAIDFGGTVYTWKSPSEIVLWVMTGVLFPAFCLTQIFHPFVGAKNKLYPTYLLKNWRLLNLQFQTFAAAGIVYIPIYYIPVFFEFTQSQSALQAAVRLLPFVFMVVFFSLFSGVLMSKLGYFMPWYVFAAAVSLVGSTLMYTVNPSTSVSAIYGYSVLIGIGGGCFLLSSFAVAPALVEPAEIFDAIGIISIGQGMGLVFFVATAGVIFQNLATQYVSPLVPAAQTTDIRPLIAGTSSALYEQLSAATRTEVVAAVVKAMGRVYPLAIAAAGLSFLFSPFLGLGKIA